MSVTGRRRTGKFGAINRRRMETYITLKQHPAIEQRLSTTLTEKDTIKNPSEWKGEN